MPTANFSAPRIYYLFPAITGTTEALAAHLTGCAQMGFTHVMVAAPSLPKSREDGQDIAASEATEQNHAMIRAISLHCEAAGLALLLDIDFYEVPRKQGDESPQNDVLPDPRYAGRVELVVRASKSVDASTASETEDWHGRQQEWVAAGVRGFCCRSLAARPSSFWRALITQVRETMPDVVCIAWTPGCTPAQLNDLENCGFDATIASTAWWDFSAGWLNEEAARLIKIAPPIATVDDPQHALLHRMRQDEDDATFRARCVRALQFAAVSGIGTLVPMGLESGRSGMRDPFTGAMHEPESNDLKTGMDLSSEIAGANGLVAALSARMPALQKSSVIIPTTVQPGIIAVLRQSSQGAGKGTDEALLVVINQSLSGPGNVSLDRYVKGMAGRSAQQMLWPEADAAPGTVASVQSLPRGAVHVYLARLLPAIASPASRGKRSVEAACKAPRIAIEAVRPAVDNGEFTVKRTVGEDVDVEADVFMDGHDKLGVALLWRPIDTVGWEEVRMTPLGNDRWHAALPLRRVGRYKFTVLAWRDAFATYRDELTKKSAAGLNVSLELEEGRRLIESAAQHTLATGHGDAATILSKVVEVLAPVALPQRKNKGAALANTETASQAQLVAAVLAEDTLRAMELADDRPFSARYEPELTIDAERVAARFSSWYELFPRSQSGDVKRHGTFADVEKRLPAIRDMGFDTLYFPPIHPIGKTNRKGPNNSLTPGESDPGSPYAIGSADGGHDALHPELGTLNDFRQLCHAARDHGLEIALDFAIQCSPDHPWIKNHPDWFAWRPDGSMRYAENPPKKYEDIVNVDFYAAGAMPTLWIALRDAVLFWVNEGVRVFRVDNPHTKPLPFWQWMIGDIRGRFPDVIFLSEAFTRPKVMYRLAKVGFSQSYTYFTWRHTKAEFTDYLTELTTTGVKDYFRPHFFVNTPDINPVFLQKSGRPGFLIRAALATTLSGLWGMYSGFELCEATPVPGKEDYLDSEKYEIRAWDWQRPGNIIAEITALNRIRRANPALQTHLNIHFVETTNPNILSFVKFTPQQSGAGLVANDAVFVAINLDPFAGHETTYSLPLWQLGLPDHAWLAVEDLVHGNRFTLQGKTHQLRLDHSGLPYAIWRLQTTKEHV